MYDRRICLRNHVIKITLAEYASAKVGHTNSLGDIKLNMECIDGLSYMERIKFETDMQVDFTTDNLLVKGYERYSFGYYNWRSIYGSFPTS